MYRTSVFCVLVTLCQFIPALGRADELRSWADVTGKYTIPAELVSVDQDRVVLRKTDGVMITVPLAKLSPADQQFVKERQAALAQREAASPNPFATPPAPIRPAPSPASNLPPAERGQELQRRVREVEQLIRKAEQARSDAARQAELMDGVAKISMLNTVAQWSRTIANMTAVRAALMQELDGGIEPASLPDASHQGRQGNPLPSRTEAPKRAASMDDPTQLECDVSALGRYFTVLRKEYDPTNEQLILLVQARRGFMNASFSACFVDEDGVELFRIPMGMFMFVEQGQRERLIVNIGRFRGGIQGAKRIVVKEGF